MTSPRAVVSPRRKPFLDRNNYPLVDQLIVYTAILKHLLQQKLHYDNEGNVEIQRLERFKTEGVEPYRLNAQEQVVKKVQAMLPSIVSKMRNDVDKLERFLNAKNDLIQLNGQLYEQGCQLLSICKENLNQTP